MTSVTNAAWKFDDGTGFAVNCFPARGINRGTHEGSGSWIVAYAHQQQSKLQEVFKPFQEGQHDSQESSTTAHKDYSKRLTTDFLINHHHIDFAKDLCSANICDYDLCCADDANFTEFCNVAYINAAENLLLLRPFSTFPNLRELELAVNGIRGIDIQPGDFPCLQVLDLSYNNLSSTDVLYLGFLPKLKVLNLTGNGLSQIHPDLSQPYLDNNGETHARFLNLEVLLLDDNNLNDISVFASLAALPSLKELNLDKNNITLVPYLKVIGEKIHSETHSPDPSRLSGKRKSNSSNIKYVKDINEVNGNNPSKSPASDTDNDFEAPTKMDKQTEPMTLNATAVDFSNDGIASNPAFPHLRIMSLANNKITEEEHLLAVAAWPELQALILHGNPLTTNGKGEPPLLSHYLSKRLGISIIRFKPKAPVVKPSLRMPPQEGRKVSSHVPKIPKQTAKIMLDSWKKPAVEMPSRAAVEIESSDSVNWTLPSNERNSNDEENVFLTQLQENSYNEPHGESLSRRDGNSPKSQEKPELMEDVLKDATKEPDIYENLSIQGNVRMLRQILHHPLSITAVDSSPEKRLRNVKIRGKSLVPFKTNRQDIRVLSKPDVKQTRHRKIDDTLSMMRHRPPVSLELPLIDALNHPEDKKLRDEADILLRDIEAKYRVVREESLKASRQARRAVELTTTEINKLKSSLQ